MFTTSEAYSLPVNSHTTMSATADRPHLLVYPFSSPGHIIPLLDLTERLISRGLSVTVLVTPPNLRLLQPLLSRHPTTNIDALVVPAPEPASSVMQHRLIHRFRAMQEHHSPAIISWFASRRNPPVAIISDFFLGWTLHLARQLGIPRIVFSPSAAFALSVDFSLWRDLPMNEHPQQEEDDEFVVTLSDLPNSPSYPWWQLSFIYRMFIRGDPVLEFHRDAMLANIDSWGAVFNSFAEIERPYLDYMEKRVLGRGRVWAVGPLLPPPVDGGSTKAVAERGGSSSVPVKDVVSWLDACSDLSVVYICFGSRMVLNGEQTAALAEALETSGVHFIWCVREDGSNSTGTVAEEESGAAVPEGFEDRTARRGLVIKGWAPQVLILQHRAVGSFVTHCGWNSVLEGLAAGVVMLTWPMGADQFSDAKLLVDQLGVGIRAHEREDRAPNPAELAQILVRSVDGSIPERARAGELREAAAAAVSRGGSSDKDLDALVEALKSEKINA
ncbi:hypothetical protein SAY86_016631 [Trapa natans]|uniref:Uncharacterized protein n=1 Tax=Trapa natans TaxID=22666 RepID=A0AAN7LDK6_TRANT|nr:hypothetical protein SAY86_016631 [Trapa natans]